MTGVYLAEICLIGLFAINVAPGPVILMAIFLGATAIFHAIMDHALEPLKRYVPPDMDDDNQWNLYRLRRENSVVRPNVQSHLMHRVWDKKDDFLGMVFNPRRYKSHQTAQQIGRMNPDPPPSYEEAIEQSAYANPAVHAETPALWIPKDEMGLSKKEIQESSDVCRMTDDYAWLNQKGNIEWDAHDLTQIPVYEKKIAY